ncbi:MAG: YraN family protein, partial [Prevotella sp.]|nr:YraN family protein [Prevotella sp.]
MASHNELGKWGECIAAEYLREKGWYIRHLDWHDRHKDLDIVAIDGDMTTLLVAEVKTRSSSVWGEPDESIDLEKKS